MGDVRTSLPRSEISPQLAATIVSQYNVVTRSQLNAAGIDDKAMSRRVRAGVWQRVLPGIYVVTSGALNRDQRFIAASLYAGDQSQITSGAALQWYRFRYAPASDVVQVLVPHAERCRSTGFVLVQRTLELDAHAKALDQFRVCSPARAVVDLCRQITDLRTTRAVMAEAVQQRHTSLDRLEAEVRRAGRSRTAIVRHALAEILAGTRSAPEAELRALLETSTVLPAALWNPTLRTVDGQTLPTPDGYIHEAALAFEVDSREFHADAYGWATTLDRDNALGGVGIDTAHFTPNDIRRRPKHVLRRAERRYLARIGRVPPPPVVIIPCR
jgi:hypothetical protein